MDVSTVLNNTSIRACVGVLAGALITSIAGWFKSWLEKRHTREILIKELRYNRKQINEWCDLLKKYKNDPGNRVNMPIYAIDAAFKEFLKNGATFRSLSEKEIEAINHTYMAIKFIDERFQNNIVGKKLSPSDITKIYDKFAEQCDVLIKKTDNLLETM